MTCDETRRLSLVDALLAMTSPLQEIIKQLATMDWDYAGAGVELRSSHLTTALHKYLQDELTGEELELWANQIEGRDDVWFEIRFSEKIEEVLYELANPILTRPLDPHRARQLIEGLGNK